jgi:3'-5' exoribonuclease
MDAALMKKQFVSQIRSGETIDDRFAVSEKFLSRKKDGNAFLNLVLSDKTGTIKAVVWDDAENISRDLAVGEVFHVNGAANHYRDTLQIIVRALVPVPRDSIDSSDYLPASRRDPDQMMERLIRLADTIQTPYLHALLKSFWEDEDFMRRFRAAPAAKHMHHAYIGGLLEHTLSLALLADKVADHYAGIDRDLLITGAILHDIGKTRELEFDNRIDYSMEGRLISHIVIGVEMVEKKISGMDEFPAVPALLLKHMLISHHGSRELGSPEPPKTLEAVLLNYLDEIDAKINGIREFMASQDPEAEWTSYHKLLERFFYKGNRTTG